jgi:hypothetical protein
MPEFVILQETVSAEYTNEIFFDIENYFTKGYYFVIVLSNIRTEIIKIAVN